MFGWGLIFDFTFGLWINPTKENSWEFVKTRQSVLI